jgi:hypothetical protein
MDKVVFKNTSYYQKVFFPVLLEEVKKGYSVTEACARLKESKTNVARFLAGSQKLKLKEAYDTYKKMRTSIRNSNNNTESL